MLTSFDIILSAYFEVLLSEDFDSQIVLAELMVNPIDIVVEGRLL